MNIDELNHLSNHGWFISDYKNEPKLGSFCMIITKDGNIILTLFQYEREDDIHEFGEAGFYELVEPYFNGENYGYDHVDTRFTFDDIDYWQYMPKLPKE